MKHPLFGLTVMNVKDRCGYKFVEFTPTKAIVIEEESGQIVTLEIEDVRFHPSNLAFILENSDEQ